MLAIHPVIVESVKWAGLLLLALVGFVVLVMMARSSWQAARDVVDKDGMLIQFRELYRTGKLSSEEYRDIRARFADQMRQSVDGERTTR